MAFPTSPSNNQVHKEGNRAFVYDSALGVWDKVIEPEKTRESAQDILDSNLFNAEGLMLQSAFRQLTWGGDFGVATALQTWSDIDRCKLELTLKRANAKVLCYASTGDVLIDDAAYFYYYFIAKVGANSLSATGNSGHLESPILGRSRWDAAGSGANRSINGPMNMSGMMQLNNAAGAVWTFAPVGRASSGDVHTNYAGPVGRGSFWIAELGSDGTVDPP